MNIYDLVLAMMTDFEQHNGVGSVRLGSEFDTDKYGNDKLPLIFIEAQPVQRTKQTLGPQTYSLAIQIRDKQPVDRQETGFQLKRFQRQGELELILDEVLAHADRADLGYSISGNTNSISLFEDDSSDLLGWRIEIEVTPNQGLLDRCLVDGKYVPVNPL